MLRSAFLTWTTLQVAARKALLCRLCSLLCWLCSRAVLFQLNGYGLHGRVHTFEKPWFTTFESALACWVTLLLFALANLAARCWGKARRRGRAAVGRVEANGSAEPLLPREEGEGATEGGCKVL